MIIFNHGYIPPSQYKTTERYVAYVGGFAPTFTSSFAPITAATTVPRVLPRVRMARLAM